MTFASRIALGISVGLAVLAAVPSALAAARVDLHADRPLAFEANRGQTDRAVQFLARGRGFTAFIFATETVMVFHRRSSAHRSSPVESGLGEAGEGRLDALLRMRITGDEPASSVAPITGLDPLPGTTNYFVGDDPTGWHTDVPTYARVKYEGISQGVDLVFYGTRRQLEYDLIVRPGADPHAITLAFEGVERLSIDEQGDLVIEMPAGEVRQRRPFVYQEIDGVRRTIQGRYTLKGTHQVGFQVAAYATDLPLVIDPLIYATYLGGSSVDDGIAIAVDPGGNAYVTGSAYSVDFPGATGPKPGGGQTSDAFVTKMDSSGAIVFSTYLGGASLLDAGKAIALDRSNNIYVAGSTSSSDFPTTPLAFQRSLAGFSNAFVTKLNSSGSALVYSTYVGGGAEDLFGIAVDSGGRAHLTGGTQSSSFPVTATAIQQCNGNPSTTPSLLVVNAFVTALNSDGSALSYSTCLRGASIVPFGGTSNNSLGVGIALDSLDRTYVTGRTGSSDFPVTAGAFDPFHNGGIDVFVTKIDTTKTGFASLLYSTFLGGSSSEIGASIGVDNSGNAYVTGSTSSTDFPVAKPIQPVPKGQSSPFVTKLNAAGSGLIYSTFLGGTPTLSGPVRGEAGQSIAVDSVGRAYIAGYTSSMDFPTTAGALQKANGGGYDAFIVRLDATGTVILYSTYLGGSGDEGGNGFAGLALDPTGNAYVVGSTISQDFPTTLKSAQSAPGGQTDAFVARIDFGRLEPPPFPVIFIHGIRSDSTTWDVFRAFLSTQGWTFGGSPSFDAATNQVSSVSSGDFYTSNFSDNMHLHFNQQGWELAAIIQAVLGANPGKGKVILVGHSMGGLAAREYLQGLAQLTASLRRPYLGDVAQLITIGTPHGGVDLAAFGTQVLALLGIDVLSQAVEDLKPDSAAYAELNNLSKNALPTDVRYASIIGVGTPVIGTQPPQDGDGIVTATQQDLGGGTIAGTSALLHESLPVFIQDRPACDPLFFRPLGSPNQTHTCEAWDPGVWAAVLRQIRRTVSTTVAAVLPSSRSVQVGSPATAFATIINAGSVTASGCTVAPFTAVPGTFDFQTTDPATNRVSGTPNSPVDIPPGQAQSFVFGLTPTEPFVPTDIALSFDCVNTGPAPVNSGLNTLLLSAAATPVPDIVALAATLNNDGIVNIPGTLGTGVFAVATVNVGTSALITASVDAGGLSLPLSLTLCETNPSTGQCLSGIAPSVTTTINAGATPTFGIFVAGAGIQVGFSPGVNRIYVRFTDTIGIVRGSTSVAVRTQ